MNTKEIKDMAMRSDLMPSEIVITLIDKIESLRQKLAVAEDALVNMTNTPRIIDSETWHIANDALAKIRGEG